MRKFKCSICGYVYDEAVGIPEQGIKAGTKWEDLPEDFRCPLCSAPKSVFKLIEETTPIPVNQTEHNEELRELSFGEISAICSNLAKGCEKQLLTAEMEALNKISDYFSAKVLVEQHNLSDVRKKLNDDMSIGFLAANTAAQSDSDRGALRSLVWSEKVSTMIGILLERFEKEGSKMLESTKIYVCDICGFIYLGDTLPEICPVCKVPNYKLTPIERS